MFKVRSQSSIEDLKKPHQEPIDLRRALKLQAGDKVNGPNSEVFILTQIGMKYAKGYPEGGNPLSAITLRISEVYKVPPSREESVEQLEKDMQ